MEKLKKLIILSILCVVLSLSFCSCGIDIFQFNKNDVNRSVLEVETIPNGEYIVLDVREQVGGNNVRSYNRVILILKDQDSSRYYFEYWANDTKTKDYLRIAKFIAGDTVTYQDEVFVLKE